MVNYRSPMGNCQPIGKLSVNSCYLIAFCEKFLKPKASMRIEIPHCPSCGVISANGKRFYIKKGSYKTSWNRQSAPRYKCKACGAYFSSRMARRSWVTTKQIERLQAHLDLYIAFNNGYRLPK